MADSGDRPRGGFLDVFRSRPVDGEPPVSVPHGLRVATAYAWRLLLVVAAAGVGVWLIIQLKMLVIPLLVAILVTALLWPVFSGMLRRRVPRWLDWIMLAALAGLVLAQIVAWVLMLG